MRAAAHRHIVDALGNPTLPRGGGKCEGSRAEFIPVGGIDEQAREAARRSGRATATPAVAWETGWPARPAVARQAGQPARAEANHVADAAWTEPLTSELRSSGAPSDGGAPPYFLALGPGSADERQARIRMRAPSRGGADPGKIITLEVVGPARHRPPREEIVEDCGRHRN